MISKSKVAVFLFLYLSCVVGATERTIIINDVPWPPYFFIDPKGDELGIGKEIINYCLTQSGYKVKYKANSSLYGTWVN